MVLEEHPNDKNISDADVVHQYANKFTQHSISLYRKSLADDIKKLVIFGYIYLVLILIIYIAGLLKTFKLP